MLERATACLKSESARQSLRLRHRLSRSNRMLHSMFWNHGAGDLDLPPWAVSMLPFPHDLSSKRDSGRSVQRKTEKSIQTDYLRNSSAAFEGVFLDFLYPPQALAWLQRAQAHQWQRWERRNARRLPEGFIVAARGYASQRQSRTTSARHLDVADDSNDNRVQVENANRLNSVSGNDTSHQQVSRGTAKPTGDKLKESFKPFDKRMFENDAIPQSKTSRQVSSAQHDELAEKPAENDLVADSKAERQSELFFGDSPSDLSDHVPQDDIQTLRNIMRTSRSGQAKNGRDLTTRAVHSYDSLDDASKKDYKLKRELLEWFGMQQNDVAHTEAMELYKSIPVGHRTFQTYQTIGSIGVEINQPLFVAKLHNEALQNLENGYQISRTLFKHAVEKGYWSIAMQIEEAHHEWYQNTSQVKLFWIHVSEISELFRKAIQLAKGLPSLEKSLDRSLPVRRFAANFFREAVSQEFLRREGNASFRGARQPLALERRHIQTIFNYLADSDGETAKLFEETLMEMLHTDRSMYSQLHEIVSFIYFKYTKMPGVQPAQALLMLWLERLTEYYESRRRARNAKSGSRPRLSNSMSIFGLIREWRKYHGQLTKQAVKRLLTFYARSGQLDLYERSLEYLRYNYTAYEDQKDILWTMIWIHARRAELDRAQQAFAEVKRITAEHGEQPDIRCWNLLLQAHARADDLQGAFTNLQNLIDYGNVKPDQNTFSGILEMLAKRGDVEGVERLLLQCDSLVGERRNTAHLGSLVLAHINDDDVETAETTLREAIPRVRRGEILGSLLECFNRILTAHTMHRNMDKTMRTYQWIREENLQLDANSYAAIMQALIFDRRTQEAYGLMKYVMRRDGVRPTALNDAILIDGFVNNRQPKEALRIYDELIRENIRPTFSVNAAYLKAKAMTESRMIHGRTTSPGQSMDLRETMNELRKILRTSTGAEIANKHPGLSFGAGTLTPPDAIPSAYLDPLIRIYGQHQCLEAVKQLHLDFIYWSGRYGKDPSTAPIKLLESFAIAAWRSGRHDDVERCWQLAKEQADDKITLTPVPQLQLARSASGLEDASSEAEVSSDTSDPEIQDAERPTTEQTHAETNTQRDQTFPSAEQAQISRKTAPSLRHILTRILRYYLLSLHSQGRTADAIRTVTKVIGQGYTIDNKTWNSFVESLCQTRPPLALLAYVLTERFLVPNFPGWSPVILYPPRPQAVAEGLQYIKARYLSPGQLMPQYGTLVWLGGALLQLRKSLALGGGISSDSLSPELRKYVGTVSSIRRHAPKTLSVVQTMPQIPDKLQSIVLRGEGREESREEVRGESRGESRDESVYTPFSTLPT